MAERSRLFGTAQFTCALIALAVALNWPLFGHFRSTVPSDLGDPLLNIWILWWNAHHIPFTAAYWNAPIFAPAPYAFALSETLLGLTWLTTPLQWMGASPLAAYNVLYVLTPVLNGLSAYWLCLVLTRRSDAAVIGGLAYAFAPYHASQLAHIQTQAMFWMPVALAGLHKYWQTEERRWLVCFGVATSMNALTCGYFLLYFAVFLGVAVLWLAIASGTVRKVTSVLVALILAAIPVLPVVLIYRFVKDLWQLGRPLEEIESFSADVLTLFMGSDRLVFWPIHGQDWQPLGGLYPQYPGIVIGGLVAMAFVAFLRQPRRPLPPSPWQRYPTWTLLGLALLPLGETVIYGIVGPWEFSGIIVNDPYKPAGIAMDLLVLAALVSPRFIALVRSGSIRGLYTTGAIVASILALGPVGRIVGERFWYKPPFGMLMSLPGFDATRVPALFCVITVLCLSVLAAFAIARLTPAGSPRATAIVVAIAVGIVLDGWSILPVKDAPGPIAATTADLVVELPRPDVVFDDTAAMYRAMQHGRPLVNGYSGYYPPHYLFLISDLHNYCVDTLETIRGSRSLDVILWRKKDGAGMLDNVMVERWGRANREETVDMVLFHLPRAPGRPSPALVDADDLRTLCATVREHPVSP